METCFLFSGKNMRTCALSSNSALLCMASTALTASDRQPW